MYLNVFNANDILYGGMYKVRRTDQSTELCGNDSSSYMKRKHHEQTRIYLETTDWNQVSL